MKLLASTIVDSSSKISQQLQADCQEIRRDRDFFFGDFPKQKDFDEMISKVSS